MNFSLITAFVDPSFKREQEDSEDMDRDESEVCCFAMMIFGFFVLFNFFDEEVKFKDTVFRILEGSASR